MLKLLQVILAVITIVSVSGKGQPFIEYVENTKHPDIPNYCYYPKYAMLIPMHKTQSPISRQTCMKAACRMDYSLQIRHCDIPNLGCTSTAYNYKENFPDCCPEVECPDETYRTEDDIDIAEY